MQVNVFITREDGQLQDKMLVLPISPQAAIPPQYRAGWRYYATVPSDDAMFNGVDVERSLADKGFAVVEPDSPEH